MFDLHHPFRAMGTPCELRLAAPNEARARQLAELALAEVQRLEARYSRYREDSVLSAINRVAAAGGSVEVDEETAALLHYADTCHRQSGGLFDISSGLLRQAWRFAEGLLRQAWRFAEGRLPDPALIDALRPRIGWHQVQWQPPQLHFPRPGMELDFGGIVKEYAADSVAALLAREGVQHGYVNLGGDLRAFGPQPDGQPWRIGIRHPRRPGELLTTLHLSEGALASSGDYERCLVVDGRRYGHILNPHTGWPVQHLAAVSVLAPLCVVAGSAATIAMLKEQQGPDWLDALALPALWVDVAGRCGGALAPRAPD